MTIRVRGIKMTKSNTVGQIIALNQVLTQWPMEHGISTIFNMIHLGDTLVSVGIPFTDWRIDNLYKFVSNLANDIDREIEISMR